MGISFGVRLRLLLTSADLPLEEAIGAVTCDRGAGDPGAHRSQGQSGCWRCWGFVPTQVPVDALEISRHISIDVAPLRYPQIRGYPLVQDGDAHRLNEFLGVNEFVIESPTITELKMAFCGTRMGVTHRLRL